MKSLYFPLFPFSVVGDSYRVSHSVGSLQQKIKTKTMPSLQAGQKKPKGQNRYEVAIQIKPQFAT